ncbi:MAG TPA: glucan 1,4-alpha-glucosidase [Anaerolineales bacterium]|nr:glucan 1,4-alpha-glucosidase [Anaerolineales bacterium]
MNGGSIAPGAPGIPARWTSSAKSGVGTALTFSSRVWFTLSHGIFDEIYYPRVDQACTRDMGFLVTDGQDYFSEEKRQTDQQIEMLASGVPAFRLTNTSLDGRYRIEKEILADPYRDTVLQQTSFSALQGKPETYHLYVLLAPHLGNAGADNTAWIGDYKGVPMLFAEKEGRALALACSVPWLNRSAGFVGVSDGWQDLNQHKRMCWTYDRAENGNVALIGEVALPSAPEGFTLALGFGMNSFEAGQRALSSLLDGFDSARLLYLKQWQNWLATLKPLGQSDDNKATAVYRTSAAVLRTHESKRFPGGLIASLSIPWGFSKGDDDLGGYHLAWPRDLVESAGGLLAAGAHGDARRVLYYLQSTQEADGHWPQNMWLDGRPYWGGIQMDETAFPILLVDLAYREQALTANDLSRLWLMVRRAAGFLVRNGPVTPQDRWEEDPGYSPFTLAAEIAALLVAADFADRQNEPGAARYLRETADWWNVGIERWTYVLGTDLAKQVGVDGYYVRIAPPDVADAVSAASGYVPIKNRPPGSSLEPANYIVSPDALALVRFGLRAADDPRILNTVKVIDQLLKVDTPYGPAWHRYNDDGYGEHEDGSPFDGTGIGRAWPLLTGERAHYELAAGRTERARELLGALENFANPGSLIPEQVWDTADIPQKELFIGRPSGSAMPLVWAHAEYVKLLRSIKDGRVFDMPPQTLQRYIKTETTSDYVSWRYNHKCQYLPVGKTLRIELLAPALIRWSVDGWTNAADMENTNTGLGIYVADLPSADLLPGTKLLFTFHWTVADHWEGQDFTVTVVS